MADDLASQLQLPTRDEIRDKRLRDYRIRNKSADTSEGSQPFIDASVFADAMVPIYANAKIIADDADLDKKTRTSLQAYAASIGLPSPSGLPAAGASGFVAVSASVGGGTIVAGAEIRGGGGNFRYQCAATGLYGDGAQVPIVGVDTGPATNLPAGTVLTWTSPPPGIGPNATVIAQTNGAGLQGGTDAETDDELRNRIRERQANPPASGNDAAYIEAVENIPGLAVQKAFTIPAVKGPGSTGVMFTMRPARPGSGRRPSSIQISQVAAQLLSAFPADDSQFVCSLLPNDIQLTFKVTWSRQGRGWTDQTPWPPTPVSPPFDLVRVDNAVAITALGFRVTTTGGMVDPTPGQTIGVYDSVNGLWRRKQIKTVSVVIGGASWDLTFDTSNAATDTSFAPLNAQIVSPWADSLQLVVTPLLIFFDGLGPGEQYGSFFDAELRQKRQPESPQEWPNVVTNRLLSPLYSLTAIQDIVELWPTLPQPTVTGTPGVSSNLYELVDLGVFPQ